MKTINFYIGSFLLLTVYFFISNQLFCQEDTLTNKNKSKLKIVFNSENTEISNTSHSNPAEDSSKAVKIIFKQNLKFDSQMIELLSENQYKIDGSNFMVGDNGDNLKQSMGNNFEAIRKVDHAYSKRKTGVALMIVGGIVAIAGLAASSTWVKTNSVDNGRYRTTYYWVPGITIGAIIGGIGYINYTSVYKNLREAVDFYNSGL